MSAQNEEDDRIEAEVAKADWCDECGTPMGSGKCEGCFAYSCCFDEGEEPCCDHCGKPIYDWSDYGCPACDARTRL